MPAFCNGHIYIRNISSLVHVEYHLYADVLQIYIHSKNEEINDKIEILNINIGISRRAMMNGLHFNVKHRILKNKA